MTRREQLPEEATEEPRILSPAEEGARALERLERGDDTRDPEQAEQLADPDSPLRMPGELSPRPRPARDVDAADAADADDDEP